MTHAVSPAPVPTQSMTADELVKMTVGSILEALDELDFTLEALVPGSSRGRPDIAGEGLMAHLEACRTLAECTAKNTHLIADILGTRK